jgi:hypothetical protein
MSLDMISVDISTLKKPSYEWAGADSNRRHTDFQSVALPTELPARQEQFLKLKRKFNSRKLILQEN